MSSQDIRVISVVAHSAAISSKRSTSADSRQSSPKDYVQGGTPSRRFFQEGDVLLLVGDPLTEQALVEPEVTGDLGDRAARIDHAVGGLDLVVDDE
ncbi:hypothetical protein [Rhodococcus sp. ABRD24]|uniref:hypothetical protein n=1 Tax=Rhodococcus sp. ABRD24 TaxID=2507582 RepID=UPI001F623604|nr:hypothetical protein [Rhodococcus sp. ABRD24]